MLKKKYYYPKNCRLFYDANGGNGSLVDPSSPYARGSEVTVLSNPLSGGFYIDYTMYGRTSTYHADRFNTLSDYKGTYFFPGDKFNISRDTTLYASYGNYICCGNLRDGNNVIPGCRSVNYSNGEIGIVKLSVITRPSSLYFIGVLKDNNLIVNSLSGCLLGFTKLSTSGSRTEVGDNWFRNPDEYYWVSDSRFTYDNYIFRGLNIYTQDSSNVERLSQTILNQYDGTPLNVLFENTTYDITDFVKFTMPPRTTRIEPIYYKNAYAVKYHLNGGTGSIQDPNLYAPGETVTVLSGSISRSGFDFVSWNTKADGSGIEYHPNDTFTIAENVMLYAQWIDSNNLHKLSYDLNGGYYPGPISDLATKTLSSGDIVRLPSGIPIKDNYSFAGWLDVITGLTYPAYSRYTMPNRNVILIALYDYTPVEHQITYDLNGGLYQTHSGNYDGGRHYPGETITLLSGVYWPGSALTFVGWSFNNTIYDAGSYFVMLGEDITFVALWAQGTLYSVTYDLNGGLYNGSSTPPTKPDMPAGSAFYVSSVNPTKSNYIFSGWLCDVNNKLYQKSSLYTMSASDVTFTAQWVLHPVVFSVLDSRTRESVSPSSIKVNGTAITYTYTGIHGDGEYNCYTLNLIPSSGSFTLVVSATGYNTKTITYSSYTELNRSEILLVKTLQSGEFNINLHWNPSINSDEHTWDMDLKFLIWDNLDLNNDPKVLSYNSRNTKNNINPNNTLIITKNNHGYTYSLDYDDDATVKTDKETYQTYHRNNHTENITGTLVSGYTYRIVVVDYDYLRTIKCNQDGCIGCCPDPHDETKVLILNRREHEGCMVKYNSTITITLNNLEIIYTVGNSVSSPDLDSILYWIVCDIKEVSGQWTVTPVNYYCVSWADFLKGYTTISPQNSINLNGLDDINIWGRGGK